MVAERPTWWKFLARAVVAPARGGSFDCARHWLRQCLASLRMTGFMRDHEYFVYIMCSLSGTLYIGMTNSIYRRALQHRRGEIEGFSSKYHCIRLVYYEDFDDVHKAIGREKQLKGWSRVKKIALIESKNPRWEDMAEKWGAELLFAGESIHKLSS
jgi:putative endonuclease